ncbi:hypothetical protein NHQ30_005781 [Ciborinia camelliae]|nr:hypothetical protein NHQ30_005781 [Ciborinia camelliae]
MNQDDDDHQLSATISSRSPAVLNKKKKKKKKEKSLKRKVAEMSDYAESTPKRPRNSAGPLESEFDCEFESFDLSGTMHDDDDDDAAGANPSPTPPPSPMTKVGLFGANTRTSKGGSSDSWNYAGHDEYAELSAILHRDAAKLKAGEIIDTVDAIDGLRGSATTSQRVAILKALEGINRDFREFRKNVWIPTLLFWLWHLAFTNVVSRKLQS